MATRFKTYELAPGVYGTYDSQTEAMPEVYLSGPYDVNMAEADLIEKGADIQLDGDQVIVTAPQEGK